MAIRSASDFYCAGALDRFVAAVLRPNIIYVARSEALL